MKLHGIETRAVVAESRFGTAGSAAYGTDEKTWECDDPGFPVKFRRCLPPSVVEEYLRASVLANGRDYGRGAALISSAMYAAILECPLTYNSSGSIYGVDFKEQITVDTPTFTPAVAQWRPVPVLYGLSRPAE